MAEDTQGQEEELDTTPDNPEENPEENETPTNEEGADNSEELSETEKSGKSDSEIKSLLAQKEHWRKKALEAEKKSKSSQTQKEQKPSAGGENEWRSKVDFLLENRDVSEEEFDHLAAVASRRSGSVTMDSLRDAQQQEKDYISYKRKKAEEKKKVPGSTSAGSAPKNKGPKEIAKMSNEEFRAYEEEQSRQEERGI